MTKKKVQAVIKKKMEKIHKLGSDVNKDFDTDAIHDFRVAIKSLRSFLRLLRSATNKRSLKLSRKFKRLYHTAGAIRDAQLEVAQLDAKHLQLPHYTLHLHRVIERRKSEWKKHYSKKVFRELQKELPGIVHEDLGTAALEYFIETNIATAKAVSCMQIVSDTQVHGIRKKLKDILYVAEICGKRWKKANAVLEKLDLEKFKDQVRLIGDYNDQRILLQHLASFSSVKMEPHEQQEINAFCDKEAEKLPLARKRILQKTKKLFAAG